MANKRGQQHIIYHLLMEADMNVTLRRIKRFFTKLTVYLLFITICFILIINFQIHPYTSALVRAKAQNEINGIINEAKDKAVRSLNCSYSDIITVHYGLEGTVAALSVDTMRVNALRADILRLTLNDLEYFQKHRIPIPLGTILGGEIASAKGPDVFVSVIVTDALECSVVTNFREEGINQTLHTINLRLKVGCIALLPSGKCKFDVTAECPIGQTVLIGDVPEAYTKIHRLTDDISETEIDDIYDFGASPN